MLPVLWSVSSDWLVIFEFFAIIFYCRNVLFKLYFMVMIYKALQACKFFFQAQKGITHIEPMVVTQLMFYSVLV